MAIAAPVGLVVGALGSWRMQRDPLVTVVALVLGAVVGGAAMLATGWLLGPGSALEFARTARDGAVVPASLRVQPGAAWLAMPLATALGCLGFLLSQDQERHVVPRTPPFPEPVREMVGQRLGPRGPRTHLVPQGLHPGVQVGARLLHQTVRVQHERLPGHQIEPGLRVLLVLELRGDPQR